MVFKRAVEGEITKASNSKIAVYSCPLDAMQTETKVGKTCILFNAKRTVIRKCYHMIVNRMNVPGKLLLYWGQLFEINMLIDILKNHHFINDITNTLSDNFCLFFFQLIGLNIHSAYAMYLLSDCSHKN